MCPFCMATAGLMVAGSVSTGGGLAALAVKLSRKNKTGEILPHSDERNNQNVDEHD